MNSLKISNMDNQRLLASAAVFRGLYTELLDQYDVLSKFISATVTLNNLHSFTLSECNSLLKNDFGFDIPEAVVRRCVKKKLNLEFERLPAPQHGFWHRTQNFKAHTDLQVRFEDARSDNSVLTDRLIRHAEDLRKEALSEEDKSLLIDDFFSHLKGFARQNSNFPLIGHFILSIQTDLLAKQRLEHTRQGLIIVDGLRYSAEIASATLPQDLNIYVDTEIIFSAVGYHGSLRQQLFKDFLSLVNEINKKAEKSSSGKIRIQYFEATAREIENYFEAARVLVDKGGRADPGKQAMTSIVNGCANGADIIGKQAFFNQQLVRFNILKNTIKEFYDPPIFNLESVNLIEDLKTELGADEDKIYYALRQLTKINFLRRGNSKVVLEGVGHIFLSDKNVLRAVSFSQAVAKFQEGGVSFATDLDFMTERLWLKLNKGFNSSDNIPTTFDVAARTRLVLSSQLGSKVADEYQKLQSKQIDENTRMDPDTLGYLVVDLMNKSRNAEDVTNENLDLEFLSSDDFISNALVEHANLASEAKAGQQAKKALKIATNDLVEEREIGRKRDEAYKLELEQRERVRQNREHRFQRREVNLPILKRSLIFSNFLKFVYWCVPLIFISSIIYFMKSESDSKLALFGTYWTIVPVFYGIQVFLWKFSKKFINKNIRRYLSLRFRKTSNRRSLTQPMISTV